LRNDSKLKAIVTACYDFTTAAAENFFRYCRWADGELLAKMVAQGAGIGETAEFGDFIDADAAMGQMLLRALQPLIQQPAGGVLPVAA
jgi:hypothetical protein